MPGRVCSINEAFEDSEIMTRMMDLDRRATQVPGHREEVTGQLVTPLGPNHLLVTFSFRILSPRPASPPLNI
jgi:hypothetical protein